VSSVPANSIAAPFADRAAGHASFPIVTLGPSAFLEIEISRLSRALNIKRKTAVAGLYWGGSAEHLRHNDSGESGCRPHFSQRLKTFHLERDGFEFPIGLTRVSLKAIFKSVKFLAESGEHLIGAIANRVFGLTKHCNAGGDDE
jgi:hypothetical protein